MQQRTKQDLVDGPVFTPLDATHTKRLRFSLADVVVLSGDLDIRSVGKMARVRIDEVEYDVYGCSCDLEGCNCDAYIVPVEQREGKKRAAIEKLRLEMKISDMILDLVRDAIDGKLANEPNGDVQGLCEALAQQIIVVVKEAV
jgi:hypothetical protein